MKGLVKPRVFLLSAVAGLCVASSIWLLFFNSLLLSRKSVLVWGLFFLLAAAAFALVYRALPKSGLGSVFFRNPFFQAAVLLGAGFLGIRALGYDPAPPLMLLPAQTIQFDVADSGSPLSSGNIVEINGIQNGDAWVSLNRLDVSGERRMEGASVFLLPSPAGNTLRIRVNQQMQFYFRTRPDGGIVEITAGGQRETLDLYSANEGLLPVAYAFPVPDTLYLLADVIHSLGFGYAFFLIAAVIFKWALHSAGKTRSAWNAGKYNFGLLLLPYFLLTAIRALFNRDARVQQIAILILFFFLIWMMLLVVEIMYERWKSKTEPGILQSQIRDILFQRQFRAHPLADYALMFISLAPVVRNLLNNLDLFNYAGILRYLGFFVLICLAFAFLPSFFLSPVADRRFILVGCLSYLFVVFNMPFVNGTFSPEDSLIKIGLSLAYLVGLQALAGFLMRKNQRLALLFSVAFFVIIIFPAAFAAARTDGHARESDVAEIIPVTFARRPDIFLLVYESYSDPETLALYGIDQSAHFQRLEEYGFTLYPGVWTVDYPTLGSVSRLLALSDEVSSPRNQIIGNSAAYQTLRNNGYQINGIFAHDFFFTGNRRNIRLDRYYPPVNTQFPAEFARQVLEGEFNDRILFDQSEYSDYLREKRQFLETDSPTPRFLYSHTNYPGHTPPNPINRKNFENQLSVYKRDLAAADTEMIEDIEITLAANPNAIIILAGDHGPGLTGSEFRLSDWDDQGIVNRLHLLDRYGVFLAIRWPAGMDVDELGDDVNIFQDLFPLIFSALSDDPPLYDKLRISPQASPSEEIQIMDGVIRGGPDDGEALFQCTGRGAFNCIAEIEPSIK